MELKPRFTTRAVRLLFEDAQIDLMNLSGDVITDARARKLITLAGMSDADPAKVSEACDDLTPGEHIGILTEAIHRDLIPASIREATAKAATGAKSE